MEQLHESEMRVLQLQMREVELQNQLARQLDHNVQLEEMNRSLIELCMAHGKPVVVAGDDPNDTAEYELIIEEEPPKPKPRTLTPRSSIPVKHRHWKPRGRQRHVKRWSKHQGKKRGF